MQVVALIGDLVASKAVPQRAAFQRRLAKVLSRTTEEARVLASPFTLTLGDEFQAVYRRADTVLADIVHIMAEIHPVRTRFALGVGELSTKINPAQALGMDGPAFHQARAALTGLKTDGRLLRIAGAVTEEWLLVNHVMNLLSHEMESWTRNRLLVLHGLMQGRAVKDIEEGLNISRVAVYKNIRSAALDEVAGICEQVTVALNRALHAS